MAEKEKNKTKASIGPSVVLGLVGAVVVLLLLGAAVWGVGKIITKIREAREEKEEETVAEEDEEVAEGEEQGEDGEAQPEEGEEGAEGETGEAATEETVAEESGAEEETGEEEETVTEGEEATQEEGEGETEEEGEEEEISETEEATVQARGPWVANNYEPGDIKGDTYTVVWGDTLWEIAEGRYGSGFEWGKIKDANLDKVGYLPNGSRALIIPGQVLTLP